MFKWLQREDPESGLRKMAAELGKMLDDGRHIFDAASNAFLGAVDPEVVREDLFATDKRINHLERKIRRAIVVHGTVHGSSTLSSCLVLMSIVKDAERIGDYCKNMFDIAAIRQKERDDPYYEDLLRLRNEISASLSEAHLAYQTQDEEKARAFIAAADKRQDHCDTQVARLLQPAPGTSQPAATCLCYRYYKRVTAHALNIVTSIVMPLDRLDYFDEDKAGRT